MRADNNIGWKLLAGGLTLYFGMLAVAAANRIHSGPLKPVVVYQHSPPPVAFR
jgi:hypothetical protein